MRFPDKIILSLQKNFLMKKWLTLLLMLYATCGIYALSYQEYIDRYKAIAVREMKDYGIPASITLAQGILESGVGESELAVKANNHFGIKCHSDWKGERAYHDDDANNECFRKYDTPEESFVDHSLFLKNRARYSFLFEYDRTDYKMWAKGLKQAGYATDPNYPKRLTDLIEAHDLHQYDFMTDSVLPTPKAQTRRDADLSLKYVLAAEGDSYYLLAKRYHIPYVLLCRFNDVDKDSRQPKPGDRVYLQPKKNKCDSCLPHQIEEGESMYDLAQRYGIKIHRLYDLNAMPYSAKAQVGQWIKFHE